MFFIPNKRKFKLGFGNQCLLALLVGVFFGSYAPQNLVDFVAPFGEAFLKLLQMVIVPLTFSTIVASFAKLEDLNILRKLGLSTLFWFFITAIIAGLIGVLVGVIIAPGKGLQVSAFNPADYVHHNVPAISLIVLDMVPGNIFTDIVNGRIIPVILFAIFFGIALTALDKRANHLRVLFDELSQVMFKITRVIIKFFPIGIFALVAVVANNYGLKTLMPLLSFIVAIYVACFLQLIVYMVLLFIFARKNPWVFIKQFYPAMVTAFTTSSSIGTLPVTLEALVDNVKINKQVAGFVAPLGATMKMDGCGAIYPAIVCILTAYVFHIDLSIQQYILIVLTAAIATIGTAGIPGTASVMATVVLMASGLPLQGLAIVIGVDKIVDMMRTLTNVTGGGVCAVIVNKRYKE